MKKFTKKELREFGLLLGIFIPFFIGFLLPIIYGHNFRIWTLFLGSFFVLISFLKPKLLKYPYHFWMRLGDVLGWINVKIVLGIVFWLILFPIAIIMKAFNYDPLNKRFNKKSTSYRIKLDKKVIDLTKIF